MRWNEDVFFIFAGGLIIAFTVIALWAGYNIRRAENNMECTRDNTVVIHRGR